MGALWKRLGVLATTAFLIGGVVNIAAAGESNAATSFCAKMPSSKVSSIVGWTVTLGAPVVAGRTIACLYEGSGGDVSIEKESNMAASGIATRQKAEAGHKKLFYASQPQPLPKGTTISFEPLAALGASAFYWTAVIEGSAWSGADAFKGTTGYFSEMPGKLQQSKLEALERLALAA